MTDTTWSWATSDARQSQIAHDLIASTISYVLDPYQADYDMYAIALDMLDDTLKLKAPYTGPVDRLPEEFWIMARRHALVTEPRRRADYSGRLTAVQEHYETPITDRARAVAERRSGQPTYAVDWDDPDHPTVIEMGPSVVSPREVQDVMDGIAHADASGHKRMTPEWANSYREHIWSVRVDRSPRVRTDAACRDASETADALVPRRDDPRWRAAYEARLSQLDAVEPPGPDLLVSMRDIELPWVSIMDGGELQSVRESLGLTAERLGQLIANPETGRAVRSDTILKWERGDGQIPARVQRQVAEIVRDTDAAVKRLTADLGSVRFPVVTVYRTDAELATELPEHARMGARWWRHVAVRAAREVLDTTIKTWAPPA